MNKIFISLLAIAVVGIAGVAATSAYFSDTETSAGNIFTAGAIDLKIDHTRQVYNDVDCHTCSVVLQSDETNMVVAKNNVSFASPYPAVHAWEHSRWTADEDPSLASTGAKWIWESYPTKQEDTQVNTSYTFQKTFEWLGPVVNSDLVMGVGHDNFVTVKLNGVQIGFSDNEYGYQKENMLHISGAIISSNIQSGTNVLEFVVTNKALAGSTPYTNPGGLIYKFEIDGRCSDDFFKSQCRLWQSKDLGNGDIFYNFNDIKPGDLGLDIISLNVTSNDAYACLNPRIDSSVDNGVNDPESSDDVTPGDEGDLPKDLMFYAWHDNGDGVYDSTETPVTPTPILANDFLSNPQALFEPNTVLPANQTKYIAVVWCMGQLSAPADDHPFSCDGSDVTNRSQTDKLMTTLSFYAEQARNNNEFSCSKEEER